MAPIPVAASSARRYQSFWESYKRFHSWRSQDTLRRSLLEAVNKYRDGDGRVLEIGSGWGRTAVRGRIGLDICMPVIKEDPSRRVTLGNLLNAPFRENCFNLTYGGWVLMHIRPQDILRVAAEIKRVTTHTIALLEWYSSPPARTGHCWVHNYQKLFGWGVAERHILPAPSKGKFQILIVLQNREP